MKITSVELILNFKNVGDLNLIKNGVLKEMERHKSSWRDEKEILRILVAKYRGVIRVNARSIGKDWLNGCFVCGNSRSDHTLMSNICLMCDSQEEAEQVQNLFQGSHIAYYHGDKKAPQVKLGACDKHLPNLKALWMATCAGNEVSKRLRDLCAELLTEEKTNDE